MKLWPQKYDREIMTENYFCACHKNKRKQNQHFELLFFRINWNFGTSSYLSTLKNKFTSHKQYWLGRIFSENPKKTYTDRVYYKIFYYVWREMTKKLSKVATAKNFSLMSVIVTNCFGQGVLFHVITGRHCSL